MWLYQVQTELKSIEMTERVIALGKSRILSNYVEHFERKFAPEYGEGLCYLMRYNSNLPRFLTSESRDEGVY